MKTATVLPHPDVPAAPSPSLASANLRLAYAACHRLRRRNPSLSWIPIEDLMQAAVLGLVLAETTYRPELGASFATYGTRGARNSLSAEVAHHLQATRERTITEDGWKVADVDADFFTQSDPVVNDELRNLVSTLSEQHRSIVRMRYWDGMSLRDVAKRLSVSLGHAKLILEEALQLLKAKLCKESING